MSRSDVAPTHYYVDGGPEQNPGMVYSDQIRLMSTTDQQINAYPWNVKDFLATTDIPQEAYRSLGVVLSDQNYLQRHVDMPPGQPLDGAFTAGVSLLLKKGDAEIAMHPLIFVDVTLPPKRMNRVLLHEIGHLAEYATGAPQVRHDYFDEQKVNRLRRFGQAAFGEALATFGCALAAEATLQARFPILTLSSVLGVVAATVASNEPVWMLHELNRSERRADKFARQHRDAIVVEVEGARGSCSG